MMIEFILTLGIVSILFLPAVLLAAFFESTRIGRRLWKKIDRWCVKHDIFPE